MSLQVWLPLNGSLENKGLADVTVTNNNATVDSSGKIGQCYSFNGSNSKIVNTLSSAVTSSVGTLCCWVKMNSLPGSFKFYNLLQLGSLGGYATCRLGIYIEYSNYINISIDGGGTGSNRYTHSLVANRWYHICATNNGTTVKLYIDGEEVLSKSSNKSSYTTAAPYLYVGGTSYYFLNGYMNDVRYYDNALSETEIKEIAKGLVLHLPLNNNGLGNENLYGNCSDCSNVSYMDQNTNKFTVTTEDGYTCAHVSGQLQTTGYLLSRINFTPKQNEHFTFSADIKLKDIVKGTTNAFIALYFSGATIDNVWRAATVDKYIVDGVEISYRSQAFDFLDPNVWHRISITAYYGAYDFPPLKANVYARDFTGDIYIKNIKFERGTIATPWSPAPTDIKYLPTGSGIPENLFVATDMSESITANSSTDWTKHFRMYNGSAAIHTIDTTEMTDTIALTTANSNLGIAFARLNKEINLDPTQYYTISCEAKCTNTSLNLCIGLSYYNDQSTWVWRGGSNAKTFTTANTWQKITHTFKPDANTYAICYCFTVNPGASPTGTDTFSIRKCKLEKGSTATEWQPSPVDDSYKTLGYYNNIEHDASGYNHNAVKYGDTYTYTSDSPKYNVSTHFSNTNQYIKISGLTTTGFGDSYSIAWWGKPSSLGLTMQWGFGDGIRLNGMYTGRFWNTGDSSNNPLYYIGTTTQVTAPSLNVWHHYVMTGNGTKCYVYLDGELWAEAKTYKSISGTIIYINGWDDTDKYSSNNFSIQDFRIYATTLSEDDVKSLYNNNAYIDSNGKIYGKIRQ